jgi:8-oxo-dGTP pyrophosphatase MutT (NUDIX family)
VSASEDNPWTTLSTEPRFEDDFVRVDDHRVINPAGREANYGVVHFKNIGLRILPVDAEGQTFLVGQYRYGADYFSWEFPAGNQDPGEDSRDGAKRELREEIGQIATEWLDLAEIVPSGSITDQRERSYVAWDLHKAEQDLDEQEAIRVKRLPFAEAVRMAVSGEIRDAGSIVALLLIDAKLRRGELPDGLMKLISGPR